MHDPGQGLCRAGACYTLAATLNTRYERIKQ
jgi:hypothetical protein